MWEVLGQASETSGMRAAADASAKLKRSQRFGASLQEVQGAAAFGAPSAGAFAAPASVRLASPEPTADDADAAGAAMMDDDGAAAKPSMLAYYTLSPSLHLRGLTALRVCQNRHSSVCANHKFAIIAQGGQCVWAGGGIKKGTIKGTCTDMCPASEIERRERIEDISSFERFDPSRAETTTDLAVKKFARNVHISPAAFATRFPLCECSLLHFTGDTPCSCPVHETRLEEVLHHTRLLCVCTALCIGCPHDQLS